MEATLWAPLLLGLLLGVKHAFDADHLVAVSAIVSEYRNPLRAIWIGVSWGLGHTTTLLLVGLIVLAAGVTLSEGVSLVFESLVGVVLIFLGAQILWRFRSWDPHLHPHEHPQGEHWHFHSHDEGPHHEHHGRFRPGNWAYFLIAGLVPGEHHQIRGSWKPFFRVKSYVVGTVHGLAGSAALMLLALSTLKTAWLGALYILIFGLGSLVSMGVITVFLSLPFTVSARLPRLNQAVQLTAGIFSIAFGALFIYETRLWTLLIPDS